MHKSKHFLLISALSHTQSDSEISHTRCSPTVIKGPTHKRVALQANKIKLVFGVLALFLSETQFTLIHFTWMNPCFTHSLTHSFTLKGFTRLCVCAPVQLLVSLAVWEVINVLFYIKKSFKLYLVTVFSKSYVSHCRSKLHCWEGKKTDFASVYKSHLITTVRIKFKIMVNILFLNHYKHYKRILFPLTPQQIL